MIVYFADRQLNILGQATTELPDGLTIRDDNKTEDVETGIAVFECRIPYNSSTRAVVEECTHVGNYILRSHEDENEFYTIIDAEIDTKKQEAYVYAEDAGLDLLNEVVGAYEADKAYPIAHYVNKFAYDSGFQIGVNEAVNITRKLSWDGESTVTERLASVATQFGGFEISFSFDIKGLEIKNKYINIYQERGQDNGVQLRLNKDVDRIIAKKSIANLATALECTGGTPENEEDPITLAGYTYDDGDFYVSGKRLYSREARKHWTRYNWAKEPNQIDGEKGHIVKQFSYDTTNKGTLCAHAITQLKKLREIEINYEVELTSLPEGTKIGDWVSVVDDEGELYVSGRILLLESSVTNRKKAITLGEYLIRNSGISDKVTELAEQFSRSSKTAEKALGIANAAKTNAENAQTVADQAAAEVETLQTVAEEATAAVKVAQESAATAQAAADKAQEAVDGVGDRIDTLEASVTKAQEAADGAQLAADTAQERANQAAQSAAQAILDAAAAKDAADSVEATASAAKTEAEAAKSTAEAAKTQAATAQATAEAAKLDAEQALSDIAELEEQLETVSNTMTADFARKTELTEATTSLQSQISQNAANITSTVSRLDTVDETANDAKEQAQTAQSTANTAKSKADQATADAAAAQTAADEAAAAAAAAQGEADTAKAAAASAQSVADKAKTDLEAAKTDLATVTSRVDATEEEIEAAQSAVTAAQTAANKAQADATEAATKAAEAQSRANTAVTNAANAQTTANDAASQAALAKKAADEAKGDASAAQTAASEAASVAAEAQRTANTAVTNAAAAQEQADAAAQAAEDAQTAADAADAKAAKAASDLATAQQNLADVTSRVGATEEEVEAAQAAVATAQAAADAAKADAAAAQSTANTAKTNAANAQTAANNAKTAADNAQAAADEAQQAADDAQAAVDALAVRVTTAETKITQNSEAIALRATKTEVTETLDGYYTKEEADAAIQVKANEITSSVSNTYATKTALSATDTKAANAKTAADNAADAAEAAQSTADTAKANAATAQSTANTAKANAATAQTTADNAASAAADAQSTADTAVANAATAQSTANTAKTNAANAQTAANNAQKAADDAQDDVDALTTRVTTAETTISQHTDQIALRATKTEVTQTLGGYYTKSETDSAIQVSANAVTSSVASTYATKSALSTTTTTAQNALKQSAEFIKGTQTAATGSWTGVSETITALYDGLQIIYWLPYAGSGNATLNLTLADGTTTGAKNVYHKGTTRVTTHYSAGSPIKLTYLVNTSISGSGTYTGWWVDASYEGSNTYDRTRYSSAVKSLEALTKSTYYIMVGTSAGYKKAASGVSFDVSYPVLAWYYTTAVAANATTAYMYTAMPSVTLRNNVASWTGTQYAMAYLVGTLEGKTFTINSAVFTSTVPTAADGLAYIPIGILYSTYQVYFRTDNTVYAYGEDGFAPLAEIAHVDAGLAAETATDAQATADAATERVSIAESTIQQLADSIAMLITDENGASLMTQTENGWTYNMAQISQTLDGATNELDALTESLGGVDNTVQALQQAVNDLGILTDYVVITTYNGKPCIELGESENNFRLRITNTEIQFVDGTTLPAYVTNKKLMIEQAEIKGELQHGNFVWKVRSNGNMGLMWKGASNCSITYVLTNATSTNTATAAMQGSSYSTTITMDAGRVIQTLSITMGGEDITSAAYSNGAISIAEITGDVVITVAASNYINRLALAVDTDGSIYNGVGYMSGYRLSSGGVLGAQTGSYVTGFVACKVGDVIRMKNITFQYGITSGVTSNNQRLSFFDSSKTHILQTNATGLGGVAGGVKDDNGIWTQFEIKSTMSSTDCSGTAYFRLNATYIGADSIITVNEEIT